MAHNHRSICPNKPHRPASALWRVGSSIQGTHNLPSQASAKNICEPNWATATQNGARPQEHEKLKSCADRASHNIWAGIPWFTWWACHRVGGCADRASQRDTMYGSESLGSLGELAIVLEALENCAVICARYFSMMLATLSTPRLS